MAQNSPTGEGEGEISPTETVIATVDAGGAITDIDSLSPPISGVDIQWVSSGTAHTLTSFVGSVAGVTSALFSYSTVGPSILTLGYNAAALRGQYLFRMFYGSVGVSADFYIDIREAACTLPGATNYAMLAYPTAVLTEFYPVSGGGGGCSVVRCAGSDKCIVCIYIFE